MQKLFLRIWQSTPQFFFGLVGCVGCLLFLFDHVDFYQHYARSLATLKLTQWLYLSERILIDLTLVIMAASFLLRSKAVASTGKVREIIVALSGAGWPLIPFVFDGLLSAWNPTLQNKWEPFFMEPEPAPTRIALGLFLVLLGNALDVWAYGTLFRSFSIVPEARRLITSGPYRYIRHPIYLGQFIAQAGVWLCFATMHGGWVVWYLIFLLLQFSRIQYEETILEEAFGEEYLAFKNSVYWFRLPRRKPIS